MNEELAQLEAELEEVNACELEYLPNYGYSSKKEITEDLKSEIKSIRDKIKASEFNYTYEELEYERAQLCCSLGISRYC